jgi:hypothetical protein
VRALHGWMSTYDGTVKHWLGPMMLGNNATLSVDQQLTIATWATMKAMVSDFGWGRDKLPIFSQDDRDVLFKQRRPPSTVQVRLAAMESNGMPVYVRHHVAMRGSYTPTPDPSDLYLFLTLVLGCLVVQVIEGPATGDGVLRREPVAAATCLQIYPPAHGAIEWPPTTALDDSRIQAFSDPTVVRW